MPNFVIYRSSAGSGKTYTLVKEYLLMVLAWDNPTYYRKILAITFTNKAASELKERIINQLMSMSGMAPENEDLDLMNAIASDLGVSVSTLKQRATDILQHMMYNYGDLAVSTIDKFVVKILRFFNKELGLSADFSVELNTKKIIAMAVERTLEKIGRDPLLTRMSLNFSQQKMAMDKSWRIEEDLNKIARLLSSEEGQHAAKVLLQKEEQELLAELKNRKKIIKELSIKISELGDICRATIAENEHVIKNIHVTVLNFFNKLHDGKQRKGLFPTEAQERRIENETWEKKNKKSEIISEVAAFRDRIFPQYQEVMVLVRELTLQQLFVQSFEPLIFARRIYQEVENIKSEQNLILITENNQMISRVIRNNPSPFIYEKLGERFQHFMIDEFQDTSIMQWHNLIPLVEETLGMGNKSILVGDSKQSIYRFRGGEMEQLAQLPKIYHGEQYHGVTEQVFTANLQENNLAYNYRSRKEIVMFNNDLFDHIISQKTDRHKFIYQDFKQIPKRTGGGMVNIHNIDKADDALLIEAVNQMVAEAISAGYRYGDIAVLVYKNDTGKVIAENFKEAGIPIVSADSLLLDMQPNIQLVVAILNHLVMPELNKYRVVIAQYLYASRDPKEENHSFLQKYLSDKSEFNKIFSDLNIDFDHEALLGNDVYSLGEKLCKIFAINSTEAYMIEFLNICSGFVNKDKGSIRSFLTYWETNKEKLSLQISDSMDAINILSVHKSKGLEFPVVINPYYFKKSKSFSKEYLWVSANDEESWQLLPVNKLAARTDYGSHVDEEAYKTDVDKLNVLYVATTRATEVLYLILPIPSVTALKAGTSMEYLINEFAQSTHDGTDGDYRWGALIKVDSESSDPFEEARWIEDYPRLDWQDELRIAISDELKGEELTFGNRLHDLLAITNGRDEIEENLKRFVQKNYLSKSDYNKLNENLQSVYDLKDFVQWHDQSVEVLNEKEILHVNGKTLRPDRIFIMNDKVVVVDFKTGIERKSHHKQVAEYAEALNELEYGLVEGYLLYTRSSELVKVACDMRLI